MKAQSMTAGPTFGRWASVSLESSLADYRGRTESKGTRGGMMLLIKNNREPTFTPNTGLRYIRYQSVPGSIEVRGSTSVAHKLTLD